MQQDLKSLFSKLSVRFIFKNIKLTTVESCTGGLLAKSITDIAGCSDWYEAGFITYSNEAKNRLVNVPFELIEKYGAVSVEVAEAMVKGTVQYFPKNLSVSITGLAGPGGGTLEKPVGTVCIASHYLGQVKTRSFNFTGNRDDIRTQSVQEALNLLLSIDLNRR